MNTGLAESFAILEGVLESTADGIMVADCAGRMIRFNRKFVELWRLPEELADARDDARALDWVLAQLEEPQEFLRRVTQIYADPSYESVDSIRFKDGRIFERYSKSLKVGDRQMGRVWSFRDVTAHREAEQRFERLFRLNPLLMALSSFPDTRFRDVNEVFLKTIGYSRAEVIGKTAAELGLFPDLERHAEVGRSLAATGRITEVELQVRCKDGTLLYGLFSGELIQSQAQTFYLTVMLNITERRLAAQRLMESEQRLRRIGDNLPSGLVYQLEGDASGRRRFVYISAGVERIHGVTAAQVMKDPGILYNQIFEEDRVLMVSREAECLEETAPFQAEVRILNARGETRWILLNSAPSQLAANCFRWDGVEIDITERKHLEERLRQAQKMEGIGNLAGGIAHEFNNILAVMMMSLHLTRTLTKEVEAMELLESTEETCKRASSLVKQLLAFSRQSVIDRRPVELQAAITEQLKMLGRLLGERIHLELSAAGELPWVNVDKLAMEQILLNLCLNARDAMPQGGTLRLGLRESTIGPEQAFLHPRAREGRYLCLSVSDTGCGMNQGTLDRLFEPFFTTKEVGKGTGLGLSMVCGMVEQHGGWLTVESEVGRGSTFRIHLPAIDPPVVVPSVAPKPVAPRGNGTILLVEDEPTLRKVSRAFLVQQGYRVLEAATGEAAMAVWGEQHPEIGLLFADMVMPGSWNGLQLAQRLLVEKPGLKVIITSGYQTEALDLATIPGSAITYLPKPCAPATLALAVSKCFQPG